jgi:GNAT superfamily N-acetyltransferase
VATLLGQLGYPSSEDVAAARLDVFAASAVDRLVVAEAGGEVVGFAVVHVSLSIEHDEPAAKLSAIVVDEEWRGRGVGRALVEELEKEARTRGCGILFLTTNERRTDAHAFYERLGFEYTGRRFAKELRG